MNQVPDRTPASFWYHHSGREDAGTLVEQQMQWYREADLDYIKIMYDLEYALEERVETAADWNKIKPLGKRAPQYQKQLEIIKRVLEQTNGECMVLDTTFGPMRHVVWLAENSNEKMLAHIRENPEAVKNGVTAIAECMAEWMDGFLEAGADGVFYAAQFGEPGRFTEEEWEMLIKESDLVVLNEIRRHSGKYLLLHPCGQPAYQHRVELSRYVEYPKDMVNWAVHANELSLEEGRKLFQCPVMGGMDNRGAIAQEDFEATEKEIRRILAETNPEGFILGTDCSLPGKPSVDIIKHAMEVVKVCGRTKQNRI